MNYARSPVIYIYGYLRLDLISPCFVAFFLVGRVRGAL
jgi:hypothetical protein